PLSARTLSPAYPLLEGGETVRVPVALLAEPLRGLASVALEASSSSSATPVDPSRTAGGAPSTGPPPDAPRRRTPVRTTRRRAPRGAGDGASGRGRDGRRGSRLRAG